MPSGGLGANNYADGGIMFATNRAFTDRTSRTGELAWNFKWRINDRWAVQNDVQWVHSTYDNTSANVYLHTFVPSMMVDASGTGPVRISFDAPCWTLPTLTAAEPATPAAASAARAALQAFTCMVLET